MSDRKAERCHYLLIQEAHTEGAPNVLGSYTTLPKAEEAQRQLGGGLLELWFWSEDDPAVGQGLSFSGEWYPAAPSVLGG